MTKIRTERHNHYTKWKLPKELPQSPYPAESSAVARLHATGTEFYSPYPFPYSDNNDYHYHLAFLVEAVELLPLKIDLSFDAVWRAFESFYKSRVIAPKDFKIHQEAPALSVKIDSQGEHNAILDELFKRIPAQTCEYIAERILKEWQLPKTDYERIWNRLKYSNKHPNAMALLTQAALKYIAPNPTADNLRRAAMLLRLALQGKEVEVSGVKVRLPRAERISFLINALLYTFRNDRFHGNMQPPFKSSVGTLQTYAHAHYCFLWGHFLFLFSTTLSANAFAEHQKIAENLTVNLAIFTDFYGRHIVK